MTSFYMDVDMSTSFIPSFEMDLYEPENVLTSAGHSLGVWHPRFGEKKKENLVPDNCRDFLALLDKDEEEIWKSIEPSDLEPWSPHPPLIPQSPLLVRVLSQSCCFLVFLFVKPIIYSFIVLLGASSPVIIQVLARLSEVSSSQRF